MVLKTVYLCIIVFSMVKTKNYQNGKIYQVVDIAYEQCYFGSTIDTLPNRFKGQNNLPTVSQWKQEKIHIFI